jgi:hypothetical protein
MTVCPARRRAGTGLVAALLLVAACGSPPADGSGGPPPEGQTLTVAGVEFTIPMPGDGTLTRIAEEERALVAFNRASASIAESIGADGAAVLADMDAAQAEVGQEFIDDIAEAFGVESLAPVAAIGGPPADHGIAADGIQGFAGFSAAALAVWAGTASIARAGETGSGTIPSEPKTTTSTQGDTNISQQLQQQTTLTIGEGKVTAEVTVQDVVTLTDAQSGAARGTVTETATGRFEINACPDADGVVHGRASLRMQTQRSGGGAPSTAQTSLDAPFRFQVSEDARIVRAEVDSTSESAVQGGDADWSAGAEITFGFDTGSGGNASSSGGLTGNQGATDAQVLQVTGAALFLPGLILAATQPPTEAYFRGGNCVEITLTDGEGRDVEPDEEVHITAQPRHVWEGTDLSKPVVASFEGIVSVSPVDQKVDAPASFTFVAGSDTGDVGKVTLKSTSNRGIGMRTETYTVSGLDTLNVTVSGSLTDASPYWDRQVTISGSAVVHRQDDGILRGTSSMHVTFSNAYIPGCTTSFGGDVQVRVEADPVAAPSGHVWIRVYPQDPTFHPLGTPDCIYSGTVGGELLLWSVGIFGDAVPNAGSTTKREVAGDGTTYVITVSATTP